MSRSNSLIVKNAQIVSSEGKLEAADTIYIEKGKIHSIGRWEEVETRIPEDLLVLDVKHAFVVPGLMDTHVHIAHTGQIIQSINLVETTSITDVLEAIRQAAEIKFPGEIIFCTQFDDYRMQEKRYPTLKELDRVSPNNPVLIVHRTGHSSVLNTKAFERSKLPLETPGVMKDESGQPTGLLVAQANGLWRDTLEREIIAQVGYEHLIRLVAQEAIRVGLTTIHALDDPDMIGVTQPILNELPVRVLFYPQTRQIEEARQLGLRRIGGCGCSGLDGDFGPMTAALLQPYAANPSSRGQLYFEDEELQAMVLEAHRLGMQVSMHAVGDRAVAQGLEAVEHAQKAYPNQNARHRIEHWEVFNEPLAQKAVELGVMVAIQPAFNHFWPHTGEYPALMGEERIELIDPVADLIQAGLVVAGGSDSPVTPLSPLLGMHSAVNHSNPKQRVSPKIALDMFTIQAAEIAFEEDIKGSIEVGKYGDLTVLGQNPLSVKSDQIKDIPILYTIVGGEVVFSNSNSTR